MIVTVRYYAAAQEAAGMTQQRFSAATYGELYDAMLREHDERFSAVLAKSSVLIAGQRMSDRSTILPPDATAEVLPPFSGG